MEAKMLAPAAALVVWSLIMLVWLAATRLPPLFKQPGGLGAAKPGGRGQDLEGVLPDSINWKSHNYTHLMEQPTLFYAIAIVLAIVDPDRANQILAWAYVGSRVAHSLVQSLVNKIEVRFSLFAIGSLILFALTARAAWALS